MEPSRPIRIAMADDHQIVLEALRQMLDAQPDMTVVFAARNGDILLNWLLEHPEDVDVVVLDLEMPFHGFAVLDALRRRGIQVHVLILTGYDEPENIRKALEYEVEGFVSKSERPTELLSAIRQVASGRLVYPPIVRRWIFQEVRRSPTTPAVELTAREWDVLTHLARGETNTEIAQALHITENTVRFHLKNIYDKLRVTTRTEAVAWYHRHADQAR